MSKKRPYRVKPGQTFGVRADYQPGEIVELTEREAMGLLDKLEPASEDVELLRPASELYQWPLAAALVISVLLALGLAGWLPGWPAREVQIHA